jgi:hypothetical protein
VHVVAEVLPDRGFPRHLLSQFRSSSSTMSSVSSHSFVRRLTVSPVSLTICSLFTRWQLWVSFLVAARLSWISPCFAYRNLMNCWSRQGDHVARIDGHQLGHFVDRSCTKDKNLRCEAGNLLSPLPVAPKRLVKPRMFMSLLAASPAISLLSALERSKAAAVDERLRDVWELLMLLHAAEDVEVHHMPALQLYLLQNGARVANLLDQPWDLADRK